MAGAPEIQVSRLLDERGLSAFQIRLLFWAILLSLIDGYDIAAIAFAAPHLVTSWGIPRSALGPVLSASNIGVLFGSANFCWVGDRYGRKPALIGANLLSACRWAARSAAWSARFSCPIMAGRSCFRSAASCRSSSRSPPS
jgi:AAHS family 4-hydroxybenzoate transporter-like MFS transporter